MSRNVLIRWGGLACSVGGILAGVASLLDEPSIPPSPPRAAALAYVASMPMLLVGLVALYLKARVHSDGVGKSGQTWLVAGPLMYLAGGLLLTLPWAPLFVLGLLGFLGGLVGLACGLVLVGIANMRVNLLGRLSGMPVLVGALLLPNTFLGGYAASSGSSVGRAAYLVVALTWWTGWALLGYSLYANITTENARASTDAI